MTSRLFTLEAEKTLQACEENEEYFTTIARKEATEQAKKIEQKMLSSRAGKLAGLAISVKDNILVKDIESTAGSSILGGYKPLFDATAIKRLKEEDALIIAKTVCDEFGFGSFSTHSPIKTPRNPHDKERCCGGSSGGSAGATHLLDSHVALAESTGGSIVCPASFCGVVGFCPTYGAVSRNGLIPYANSLDKIGLMSRKTKDLLPVFDIIRGHDKMDGTSLKDDLKPRKKVRKIGILDDEGTSEDISKVYRKLQESLSKNYTIEKVSLPLTFKYSIPSYYIMATCEASTNLACLCGLRYGREADKKGKSFAQYFSEIRGMHFTKESKRRILLGTFARMSGFRDAYYIRAAKIRTLIIQEYKKAFEQYDMLLSPTMPSIAPKFKEIEKMDPLQVYMMDFLTAGPNLAGFPHGSIPFDSGMPVGIMAIADHLDDHTLIDFMKEMEVCR